jgi:hypothetical protein
MKPFKWLAAGLIWILASVLGLVGILLSVTLILLPVGLLVLSLSRRLYRLAGRLVVPRAVRHPVSELGDAGGKTGRKLDKLSRGAVQELVPSRRARKKAVKRGKKQLRGATKKMPGRQRRVLGIKV